MSDLDDYDWKDQQRKRRRRQQRYSWLGLVIASALGVCAVMLVSDATGIRRTGLTPEQVLVISECSRHRLTPMMVGNAVHCVWQLEAPPSCADGGCK